MKKNKLFLVLVLLSCLVSGLRAQVQWSFTAKKMGDKVYELHCSATVQGNWHIYSQFTPEGGPVPTVFKFSSNPLVIIEGKPSELGCMVTKFEEAFGINVKYFAGKVDFVQKVTLKTKVKTAVSGTVTFMVCNDSQCLPPKIVNFNMALQ